MPSIPDLVPPWQRVALVHDTTDLFEAETMTALDGRYTSGSGSGVLPVASTTTQGIVELATNSETITGSDSARAVVPSALAAKFGDFSADVTHIVAISRTAYDALGTPDATTLYLIDETA